jgi:hypothetical protein
MAKHAATAASGREPEPRQVVATGRQRAERGKARHQRQRPHTGGAVTSGCNGGR